jgi:hypothetical protein
MKPLKLICLVFVLMLIAAGCEKKAAKSLHEAVYGNIRKGIKWLEQAVQVLETRAGVEGERTDSPELPIQPVFENIQDVGEEILTKMVQANQYWLISPPSEVKTYSYAFILGNKEPEMIEVSNPLRTNNSFRQGISYYTALHKLASDPSSSIITEIQESERTIQIGFNLKKSIKIACGNGISGSWQGYFSRRVGGGTLWLDAERKVPIKAKTEDVEEHFSEYVAVGNGHYVPLRIKIDSGRMHFDWKFRLYRPGLWLFDMSHYQLDEEGPSLLVASTSKVKVNAETATSLQTPVVVVAETSESSEVRSLLSEGRRRVEKIIEVNRAWLLPPLNIRHGLVYEYRQEEPYLERIMFDKRGNIMAQLEKSKDSPDAPTRQLLYQPDGTFIRTTVTEPYVRKEVIAEGEELQGEALLHKNRYIRNLSAGLNFDCALTRMARNQKIFHAQVEEIDDEAYRLILTTTNRDAKIFTGTMLAFTSWAYMHDVRYARSEIICDAKTHYPLSELDYDSSGNLVGSYKFSDYMKDSQGAAPAKIQALIPYEKDGKDHSLEMDAQFAFVHPGLWLLRRCHSEFRGEGSSSTGEVTVISTTQESFPSLEELLARLEKTIQIFSKITNAGDGRFVTSLRFDNSIPVWTRAIWTEEAEGYLSDLKDTAGYDKPVIAVVETQCTRLDNDRIKVTLSLFSNIYWKEFETILSVELLDSHGRELSEATASTKLRTEGSPRMTKTTIEFSDIEDIVTIDKIAVSTTVKRMTAMYHGHGIWMSFMDQ